MGGRTGGCVREGGKGSGELGKGKVGGRTGGCVREGQEERVVNTCMLWMVDRKHNQCVIKGVVSWCPLVALAP